MTHHAHRARVTQPSGSRAQARVHHTKHGADLSIAGAVTTRTSAHVRTALHSALAAGEGDLVVHLRDAEVWDATGLGVIVGAHHLAQRLGRRLVVADASARLCRLMVGTRLDRVMNVRDDACGYVPLAMTA